jgi:hypothetical protein
MVLTRTAILERAVGAPNEDYVEEYNRLLFKNNEMQVVAIDPTTLLPSWTLNMQFSGATLSNIMGDNGESLIFATSIGIYVGMRIIVFIYSM